MKKISHDELIAVLLELFSGDEVLTLESDLALLIKDSIDLGELIAVVKEKYGVTPQDLGLFKLHSKLGDVLKIFNHEW